MGPGGERADGEDGAEELRGEVDRHFDPFGVVTGWVAHKCAGCHAGDDGADGGLDVDDGPGCGLGHCGRQGLFHLLAGHFYEA